MSKYSASHSEFTKMFNDGATKVDETAAQHIAKTLAEYGFNGNVKLTIEVTVHSRDSINSETRTWSSVSPFKR